MKNSPQGKQEVIMNSVYHINKAINKPVEFKGLKAQYIWYLGGSLVGLMVLFAILYFIGLSPYICVGFALIAGSLLFTWIYHLSNKYGEHGMMKKVARKAVPKTIKSYSIQRIRQILLP